MFSRFCPQVRAVRDQVEIQDPLSPPSPDHHPEDGQDAPGQVPARTQVQGHRQPEDPPVSDLRHRQDGLQPQDRQGLGHGQRQEDQRSARVCNLEDKVESENQEIGNRQPLQGPRRAHQRRVVRRQEETGETESDGGTGKQFNKVFYTCNFLNKDARRQFKRGFEY